MQDAFWPIPSTPHVGSVCHQRMFVCVCVCVCVCRQGMDELCQGMVEWAQVVKSAKMSSDHDLIDVQTTFLTHPGITFMKLTLGN